MVLAGRRIVLAVTGSIAAYKAAELASQLVQVGAEVDVIMTAAAQEFIRPLTFQSLTHRPVVTDMFAAAATLNLPHLALAERAEGVVIAPATANTIAKLAQGLADDMLSCTVLATQAPVIIAPAMEALMYAHPATQENLARLRGRGVVIVEPAYGRLASGKMGRGRLVEVREIVDAIRTALGRGGDFAGRRIVVTAGATQEPLDPVRFLSNRSSGKMGYALAEAARDRGAAVTLISGPTALPAPGGVELIGVQTAAEMREAVLVAVDNADALIMAAAVADYRPSRHALHKIKRAAGDLTLSLVQNPDILAEVCRRDKAGRLIKVGFAAETEALLENARAKRAAKGLDLVVANDVTAPGSGFGSDTNKVIIVGPESELELPLLPKYEVAWRVLDAVKRLLEERGEREQQ